MTEGEGRLVNGRYRLRRALGRGGMGVVWLASDEVLHRDVAIKEIQLRGREIRDTDPEVRRALREARAAAKLSDHPGIITVHDVVTDESGLPWIVMQVLNGRSLSTVLDAEGPLPVDRAARIGIKVLRALDYAHNAKVLHRDVKPGNVMVLHEQAEDGDQVVLTDFGIAMMDGASVLTATGQLPGAPEYIAPERILGEEALPAADLWSVGIMLYGMVVGRTPFHRADVQATLGAALTREPDPDPNVGRLGPVIKGLLRKKPAERMTAGQAIDKLSEIAAVPASVPDRLRVKVEYPTSMENPDSAATVVGDTVPNTLTSAPPFTPPPVMRVTPDSPTLDPVPPRRPRPKRALVVGGAITAVVAVVATVVLVSQSNNDDGGSAAPDNRQPTTTTTVAAKVPLKPYQEPLGFEVGIPSDWKRTASTDGSLAFVFWQGVSTDPNVGAMTVRVLRDATVSGVSPATYLLGEEQTQKTNGANADYDQVALSDNGSSADLEYTFRAATGETFYRVRTRAVAPGDVFTLTFTLYADNAATLRKQWEAAGPLMVQIRDSFHVTP